MDRCPWCGILPIKVGFCRGNCRRMIYLHRYEDIDRGGRINVSWWRCIDPGGVRKEISHETIITGREFICKHCIAEKVLTE